MKEEFIIMHYKNYKIFCKHDDILNKTLKEILAIVGVYNE